MNELSEIWASILVVVAAVGTLIARYQGTNENNSWFRRLMTTIDMTQVIDSTRKLDD